METSYVNPLKYVLNLIKEKAIDGIEHVIAVFTINKVAFGITVGSAVQIFVIFNHDLRHIQNKPCLVLSLEPKRVTPRPLFNLIVIKPITKAVIRRLYHW